MFFDGIYAIRRHEVVIDTNIFISALLTGGKASRQVRRLCLQGSLTPLMGSALFAEYEDVSSRDSLFATSQTSKDEREALLDAFLSCCRWTPIYFLWRPNLRDEADNHLIELAAAGGAEAIVTANLRDFSQSSLVFPHLDICTAGEFLSKRRLS